MVVSSMKTLKEMEEAVDNIIASINYFLITLLIGFIITAIMGLLR